MCYIINYCNKITFHCVPFSTLGILYKHISFIYVINWEYRFIYKTTLDQTKLINHNPPKSCTRIFVLLALILIVVVLLTLPVVLYGCETWSLTLREECRLRVYENRMLRRIFGPKVMTMGNGEGMKIRNFIVSVFQPNIVTVN